eukprot:m51a1_g14401 hypothetical protein (189) ;mRNA; r:378737-379303
MGYSLGTAYVFWGVGLCGTCGFQRFYINDTGMGLLYFFTGGLCGVGALLDICLLPGAVERANARSRPATVIVNNAPAAAPVTVTMTNVYAAPAPQQPVVYAQPGQPVYAQPGQPVYAAPPQAGQPVYVQPGQPVYAAPPGQPQVVYAAPPQAGQPVYAAGAPPPPQQQQGVPATPVYYAQPGQPPKAC